MAERYAPGEAARLVRGAVGSDWTGMSDLVKITGLTRNTIRNCLVMGGFETRKGEDGRLEARQRIESPATWLRKKWVT